jgi:hypothetical protein
MGGYRPKAPLSGDDRRKMERIAEKWPSTAAKIRALDAAGYNRQEIATFLGKSYQHVYNTLSYPLSRAPNTEPAPSTPSAVAEPTQSAAKYAPEAAAAPDADPEGPRIYRFDVDSDGSIRLPPEALNGLDAVPGRLVTARFEDGELKLMSIDAAVRFVQRLAAPYVKEGEGNWSDQLIEERRAEAALEAERDAQ